MKGEKVDVFAEREGFRCSPATREIRTVRANRVTTRTASDRDGGANVIKVDLPHQPQVASGLYRGGGHAWIAAKLTPSGWWRLS